MATNDEIDNNGSAVLRRQINISRPVYNEKQFQQIYQSATKENAPIKEQIKKKLSRCHCSSRDVRKLLQGLFPITRWLPQYDVKKCLLGDVMAGLTVGVMRLPQGMAYGLLATLAPVYGLYTVFFPALIYCIMGTSMHLSIGSFAVVSIMTATAVEKGITFAREEAAAQGTIIQDEGYERARIATTLAFLSGVIQIGLGLLHLGFISTYLALPLVRGFTTGAAVYVFNSQFKNLFGITIFRYEGPLAVVKSMGELVVSLHKTNLAELLISIVCLTVLVIVKELQERYLKKRVKYPIPIELFVIVIGTAVSYGSNFSQHYNVDIIGAIPTGLPYPVIPPMKYASIVITDAFTISIVTFSVAVSMGVIFAKRNNYEIDSNQELFAIGTSNVVCSFLLCYPAAGSLSRSLLQEIAGGKTQIAGALSCMFILLVLLFMAPLFQPLPKSVLASIVVVALRGMFRQFHDIKVHWKYSKIDCFIWLVTFCAVVLLGVDLGLGVGVVFAIFTVVVRTQHPQYSVMGRIPGTDIYRDSKDYQMVEDISGVKIFGVQSPIYYANGDYIKDSLYSKIGIDPLKIQVKRARAEIKTSKLQKKARAEGKKRWRKESQNDEETQGVLPDDYITTESNNCVLSKDKDISVDIDSTQAKTNIKSRLSSISATYHKFDFIGDNDNSDVVHLSSLCDLNGSITTDNSSISLSNGGIHTEQDEVHTIVLDLSAVSFVDIVGIDTIKSIVLDYEKIGVNVLLAQCRANIQQMLFQSGCMDVVGLDRMFITLQDAVLYATSNQQQTTRCSGAATPDSGMQELNTTSSVNHRSSL